MTLRDSPHTIVVYCCYFVTHYVAKYRDIPVSLHYEQLMLCVIAEHFWQTRISRK